MISYFLLLIITLLIQIVPAKTERQYLWRTFWTFVPLFLFGALRVNFGLDYEPYQLLFEEIQTYKTIDVDGHAEIGYQLLCKILPSFRTLLVLTSLLMCVAYGILFYRIVPPKYSWFALILLFLAGNYTIYFTLGSIRNGIAASLFVFGLTFIQKRRIIAVALLTILAYYFHTSAIFSIPIAYLIAINKKFTKKEFLIWSSIVIFLMVVSVGKVIDLIAPYFNVYFSRYDSVFVALEETKNSTHYLAYFGALVIFIFIVFFLRNTELSTNERSLFRLALFFVLTFFMGALNARMTQYYSPFFIAASTIMVARWNNRNLKYMYMAFLIGYFIYSFFLWTNSTWFAHREYHSIIDVF